MNHFAKNLKTIRKAFKKTQEDLALHLNKGQTTIGNWENGISEPNIDELLILSKYFGIEISTLVGTEITDLHLTGSKIGKYSISGMPESVVNEHDELSNDFVLKQLQKINADIKQLQLSVKKLETKRKK